MSINKEEQDDIDEEIERLFNMNSDNESMAKKMSIIDNKEMSKVNFCYCSMKDGIDSRGSTIE